MARIITKWNKDKGERSFADTASALCTSIWKITTECVLNLENAGFETDNNTQRLDILTEFAIFAIHILDRKAHVRMEQADRQQFVIALADRFATIIQDNRTDLEGPGDYRKRFIDLFNTRCNEYSDYDCDNETGEPGFSLRRVLGEHVRNLMGEKDRKWVPDYVIDKEAPGLFDLLGRASRVIFD